MTLLYNNIKEILNSKNALNFFYSNTEATPWQINFQDPATPIAERIIDIHHHVFFF